MLWHCKTLTEDWTVSNKFLVEKMIFFVDQDFLNRRTKKLPLRLSENSRPVFTPSQFLFGSLTGPFTPDSNIVQHRYYIWRSSNGGSFSNWVLRSLFGSFALTLDATLWICTGNAGNFPILRICLFSNATLPTKTFQVKSLELSFFIDLATMVDGDGRIFSSQDD